MGEYKMTRDQAVQLDKYYYVDEDDDTGMWCVFGDESGFAYSSWGDEQSALDALKQMEARRIL